jgi:hypothetical protein
VVNEWMPGRTRVRAKDTYDISMPVRGGRMVPDSGPAITLEYPVHHATAQPSPAEADILVHGPVHSRQIHARLTRRRR